MDNLTDKCAPSPGFISEKIVDSFISENSVHGCSVFERNKQASKKNLKNLSSRICNFKITKSTVAIKSSTSNYKESIMEGNEVYRNNATGIAVEKIMIKRKSMADGHVMESGGYNTNKESFKVKIFNCAQNNSVSAEKSDRDCLSSNGSLKIRKSQMDTAENSVTVNNITSTSVHDAVRFINNDGPDLQKTIKIEPEEITIVSGGECDTADSYNVEPPPEKKKRGRPRKSSVNLNGSMNSTSAIGKNNNERAIGRSGNDEKRSHNSVSFSEELVKRKRGRPRKTDVTLTSCLVPVHDKDKQLSNYLPNKNCNPVNNSDTQERRRKITKPKRFSSFESFEFMDVNDKNAFPMNNTNTIDGQEDEEEEDDADDFVSSRLCIEHIEAQVDDDDDEQHENKRLSNVHDGSGDAVPRRVKKKRIVKLALGRDEENEFDAFGKNVALQLKELSLQDALELQIKILSLISNKRLQLFNNNPISSK